jgi:hypothetical protein
MSSSKRGNSSIASSPPFPRLITSIFALPVAALRYISSQYGYGTTSCRPAVDDDPIATILTGPPPRSALAKFGNGYLKPVTSSGSSARAKQSTM